MARGRGFLSFIFLTLLALATVNTRASANQFSEAFVVSHRGVFTQGGLIVLSLMPDTELWLNGQPVEQLNNRALVGFGRDAALAQELRFARTIDGTAREAAVTLTLQKRDYQISRIEGLPKKLVTPPPEVLDTIRQQSALKRAARATSSRQDWFSSPFAWPATGRISGVYGSQRFYNGKAGRPHYGLDIAAPRTTPVYAPAPGRVSLAETDMYFEGGLIFLDHGLSLTSVFMHLDSLHVKVGDIVEQGDLIGRIGSTGRSTGPHLDWRMTWHKHQIDPALLLPPRAQASN
jgi:murein DD-endopeptidase MepM/ murein hydrolase activator NlpD